MFTQMMKFQMESQQENEERILKNEEKQQQQLQKENEERIFKKKTWKNNNDYSLNYKNNKKNFLKV